MSNFDDDEAAAKVAIGAGCIMFGLYIIGIITVIAVIIAAAIKFL